MKKTKWFDWQMVCFYVCLFLLLLRLFFFTPIVVNGSSMIKTLHNNDHLLMYKLSSNYNRKDIIIAKDPINPNKNVIKRVIGLPGETLEIINNKVYINNHRLDEPYAYFSKKNNTSAIKNYKKIYIPKGRIFIMGDNRYNSFDSREFGTIDIASIKGKIL